MELLQLIILIAVCGLVVWAITALIPMPAAFKNAIYVIAIVALVIFVLQSFGLLPRGMPGIYLKR